MDHFIPKTDDESICQGLETSVCNPLPCSKVDSVSKGCLGLCEMLDIEAIQVIGDMIQIEKFPESSQPPPPLFGQSTTSNTFSVFNLGSLVSCALVIGLLSIYAMRRNYYPLRSYYSSVQQSEENIDQEGGTPYESFQTNMELSTIHSSAQGG